jgi:hypothetical protein
MNPIDFLQNPSKTAQRAMFVLSLTLASFSQRAFGQDLSNPSPAMKSDTAAVMSTSPLDLTHAIATLNQSKSFSERMPHIETIASFLFNEKTRADCLLALSSTDAPELDAVLARLLVISIDSGSEISSNLFEAIKKNGGHATVYMLTSILDQSNPLLKTAIKTRVANDFKLQESLLQILLALSSIDGIECSLTCMSKDVKFLQSISDNFTNVFVASFAKMNELSRIERVSLLEEYTDLLLRIATIQYFKPTPNLSKVLDSIRDELISLNTPGSLNVYLMLVQRHPTSATAGVDFSPLAETPWLGSNRYPQVLGAYFPLKETTEFFWPINTWPGLPWPIMNLAGGDFKVTPNPAWVKDWKKEEYRLDPPFDYSGRLREIEREIENHGGPRSGPLQYPKSFHFLIEAARHRKGGTNEEIRELVEICLHGRDRDIFYSGLYSSISKRAPTSLQTILSHPDLNPKVAKERTLFFDELIKHIKRNYALKVDDPSFDTGARGVAIDEIRPTPFYMEGQGIQDTFSAFFPATFGDARPAGLGDWTLSPIVYDLRIRLDKCLDSTGVKSPQRSFLANLIIHTEFQRQALMLLAADIMARKQGESRKDLALDGLDERLAQLSKMDLTDLGVPRTVSVKSIAPTLNTIPDLLLNTEAISIEILGREISIRQGLFKEVIKLTSAEGAEQTFTWIGEIPLVFAHTLRKQPRLLDFLEVSLAMRDIRSTLGGKRSILSIADYVAENPYAAIPILLSDRLRDDIPFQRLEDSIVANCLDGFGTNVDFMQTEALSQAANHIPGLPATVQGFPASGVISNTTLDTLDRVEIPAQMLMTGQADSNQTSAASLILNAYACITYFAPVKRWVTDNLPEKIDRNYRDPQTGQNVPGKETFQGRSSIIHDASQAIEAAQKYLLDKNIWDLSVFLTEPIQAVTVLRSYVTDDFTRFGTLYEIEGKAGSKRVSFLTGAISSDDAIRTTFSLYPNFIQLRPDFLGLQNVGLTQVSDYLAGTFEGAGETPTARARYYHGIPAFMFGNLAGVQRINPVISPSLNSLIQISKELERTISLSANNSSSPNPLLTTALMNEWRSMASSGNKKAAEAASAKISEIKKLWEKAQASSTVIGITFTPTAPFPIAIYFETGIFKLSLSFDGGFSNFRLSPSLGGITLGSINLSATTGQPFKPGQLASLGRSKANRTIAGSPNFVPLKDSAAATLFVDIAETALAPTDPNKGPSQPDHPLTHKDLQQMDGKWESRIKNQLELHSRSLQGLSYGIGEVKYDEDAIVVSSFGVNLTAETLFQKLLTNLNGTIRDPGFTFLANFKKSYEDQNIPIQVGTIFDIDVPGPYAAPVIVVDIQSTSFTVHTLNGHPVCGTRTFGFRTNTDGTVSFYTKAVTRINGDKPFSMTSGAIEAFMSWTWTSWIRGIETAIKNNGGKTGAIVKQQGIPPVVTPSPPIRILH